MEMDAKISLESKNNEAIYSLGSIIMKHTPSILRSLSLVIINKLGNMIINCTIPFVKPSAKSEKLSRLGFSISLGLMIDGAFTTIFAGMHLKVQIISSSLIQDSSAEDHRMLVDQLARVLLRHAFVSLLLVSITTMINFSYIFYRLKVWYLKKTGKAKGLPQILLNQEFTPPSLSIEELYFDAAKIYFFGLIFISFIPLYSFLQIIVFIALFWSQKYYIVRQYSSTKSPQSGHLSMRMIRVLRYTLLFQGIVSSYCKI